MALQLQTFNHFTPAMYTAFAAKIQKDTDVTPNPITETDTSPAGEIVHGSFTFTYKYDSATSILTVQCLKKPLFIPASTIINGMAEEIAELIATVNQAPTV
jgi:hypothetical protein